MQTPYLHSFMQLFLGKVPYLEYQDGWDMTSTLRTSSIKFVFIFAYNR